MVIRRSKSRTRAPILLAAGLLGAAASACAPNPIVARDPVPAPGPGDAYLCDSRPSLLNAFRTNCREIPRQPVTVLRSAG